jgi:long-chain acyl-CoA synthetase
MSLTAAQYISSSLRHIGQIFFQRVTELGDRPFARYQKGAAVETVSWREFGSMTRALLLGLRERGLRPADTIAIIGNNSIRWLCADLATLASGLPNVVVSPSLSDPMLLKVLRHAGCRAAFVQNERAIGRLIQLRGHLPELEQIIVMESDQLHLADVLGFDELLELGARRDDALLREILETVHPDDLATIMYTSGSTGEPKGVMRTQDNLLANITNGQELVLSAAEDLLVIVLSLNHLYGRFGFLKSAVTGRSVALVESTELELDLDTIRALAGTAMATVPRVMERLWNEILDRENNRSAWSELEELDRLSRDRCLDEPVQQRFDALRRHMTQSVRRLLGGRMKYISYGGAPMPPRIMRFYQLIGIPLLGSYGLTECGGVTLCGIGEQRPGNLGKPFPNVEIAIADDGEILVRGPTVTPGYFKDPQATSAAFNSDGWFCTGDLGTLEADGSLTIVGRKKDVFYCTDGSNIYPGFIELRLENEPFIRQAILLGDHLPFIAALIVPDRARIAAALGRDPAYLTGPEISSSLWKAVEWVNQGLEATERIRRFAVCERDFPPQARSVNVFQKVKIDRGWVAEHFKTQIAALYTDEPQGGQP